MDITKELTKFNITDVAIAELKDRYMGLTIKDLDDREGFKAVHEARMDVKSKRVEVTKAGKGLREEATAYNKAVLAEEKRIISLLEPIETHLETEETRITDEKERIKNEARLKEEAKIKERTDRLYKLGMTWNGTVYGVLDFTLPYEDMKSATDEQFETFCGKVDQAITAYMEAQLAAEKAREVERQKLAEVEAENRRLTAEREAAEKAEQQRLAEIARAQELENARHEAAERATAEAIARASQEAEAKALAEEKARKDAERKAARAPDKEKLMGVANLYDGIRFPTMKTEEGLEILTTFGQTIMTATKELRKKAGAL